MIDLALLVDMLPGANDHALGRRDVYHRGLPRVLVRYPDGQREAVGAAAKIDGERAGEVHQQRAGAIGGSIYIGTRRQGRVAAEHASDAVVATVDVLVFACQDAVEPVEDMLLDCHDGSVMVFGPRPVAWVRCCVR